MKLLWALVGGRDSARRALPALQAIVSVSEEEIVDYCRSHYLTGHCPLCVGE